MLYSKVAEVYRILHLTSYILLIGDSHHDVVFMCTWVVVSIHDDIMDILLRCIANSSQKIYAIAWEIIDLAWRFEV